MNEDLKQAAWKKLWQKIEQSDISRLDENERIWINVDGLIGDVSGGGLISFFYNHGADDYEETIEDLKKINANNAIELVNQIARLFPAGKPPKDIEERNEIINSWDHDELNDYFEELDDQFYEIQDDIEKKLEPIIDKAIRKNK